MDPNKTKMPLRSLKASKGEKIRYRWLWEQPRDVTNPQESWEGKATLPRWVINASSKKKTTELGPEVKNPAVTSEQHAVGFGREAGYGTLADAGQDARQSCWRGRSGWGPWSSAEGPQVASVRIPTGPCWPSGDMKWFGTQQWFNQLCLRNPALVTVERRDYRQEKLKDGRFSGLLQVCEDLS